MYYIDKLASTNQYPGELSEGTSSEKKEAGSPEPGITPYQWSILGVSSAPLISL